MASPLFPMLADVNGETRFHEHPALKRSDLERAANVTPAQYAFAPDPIVDARRYGFSESASAATNAAAITAANDVLSTISATGGTIFLPAGNFNVEEFELSQWVSLRGSGKFATRLLYAGTDYLISVGNDTNALSYGCGVYDLAIYLSDKDGKCIYALCTIGAHFERLYLEGAITASRTNVGVFIAAGNESSFFNSCEDVECNHMENGFIIGDNGGSSRATTQYIKNCNALGDKLTVGAASIGVRIMDGNGDGTKITCGNFEHCGIGIFMESGALPINVCGTHFEFNGTDIYLTSGCKGGYFDGLVTDDFELIFDPDNVGTFVGCKTITGVPWLNRMPGGITFGNTGDNLQKYIRLGSVTFAASATATISLSPVEPDVSYRVFIQETGVAGTPLTYRVPSGSRATNQFVIAASASTSNTVDWMLVR